MLKTICSQKDFECLVKKCNYVSTYMKFKDSFGDINYINVIKKGNKIFSSICEGYLSYNESKTLNRAEINRLKNDELLIELFNDGVLYEVDTYPINNNEIPYPIRDVEFLSKSEVLFEILDTENDSILNLFLKEA